MARKVVHTESAPRAVGPYSQAIEANGIVYTAGQLPLDLRTGILAGVDVASHTRQVLENLRAVLVACGLGLDSVVKTTIFLTDLADFDVVNRVYGIFFPSASPARTTVQVAALPKGASIEIEAVALC